MRKHLSVLALAARGTLWRVLAVTLLAAALSGALLWLVPAQEPGAAIVEPDGTETPQYVLVDFCKLPGKTGAAIACAAGFAALLAVLSLNGCGYGAKTGCTVQRLRVGEGSLCLWWTLYYAVCVLFYWAVMAAVFTAVVKLRIDAWTPPPYYGYTIGGQTLLLTALCAAAAAQFSHAQRRGRFSIAPLLALALTILSFFFPMGSSTTLLVCLVTALALGITLCQFQKGETDDDAKTDFRSAQNP